jgi:hypothetical protein
MSRREPQYRAASAIVVLASLFVSDAGSDTQQPENSCHAEVTTKDNNVMQCPLATLHFHIAVSDCSDSRGSFEYKYLMVVPGTKKTARRTAAWIATEKSLTITDRVPLACDEEVDDVEVQRIDCSCVKHSSKLTHGL